MRQGGGKFAASRSPGGGPVELAVLPSPGGVEVASCASASPGGARCRHRWEERQTGIEPRWAVVRRHVGEREPLGGSLEGQHRGPRDAPAKKKRDPNTKKPQDWDDQESRSSSEDKKPEGYDDVPKEIIYPDVTKHEDWDEEEYGEWTAPTIPNVDYKGPWTQKIIHFAKINNNEEQVPADEACLTGTHEPISPVRVDDRPGKQRRRRTGRSRATRLPLG